MVKKKLMVTIFFLIIVLLMVRIDFAPSKLGFSEELEYLISPEPELHMHVNSSLKTWYRDFQDRPVAQYMLSIGVGNSGDLAAYFVFVSFSILKEGHAILMGLIPIGNVSKDETKNIKRMFELNDGYYEVNLTLETPSKIWGTFSETFLVDFPRHGYVGSIGDFVRFYVTPDDPIVQGQVDIIGRDVDSLYAWVGDNIYYVNDSDVHGAEDYWQLPYETLNLTTGDCEDQAFLLCSLFRASGIPAEDVFVAIGTVDEGGHAWVLLKTIGGWRLFEPTTEGIIERFLTDIAELFGLIDREYYSVSNDIYFEEINHLNNQPYLCQSFKGWHMGDIKLPGSRVTVEVNHNVTLKINVTNLGRYIFIGFLKIEIRKDIVFGTDLVLTSERYPTTIEAGKSQQLEFTFTFDETTEDAIWRCRHLYYKIYTCFTCIYNPEDADTRECLFVTPEFLHSDLNDDGTVNIVDITIIAIAFGSTPEDPDWNPVADIAEPYGEINILDIATVAKDYGKTV